MRNHICKIIAVIFVLSVTAQQAVADCNKATIKGNFAGEALFLDSGSDRNSVSIMMIYFNGTGGLSIKKIVNGKSGLLETAKGGGQYGLAANCTGNAKITLKQNTLPIDTGRLDYTVGGTQASPEIVGIYSSDDSTASVRLIKSNL